MRNSHVGRVTPLPNFTHPAFHPPASHPPTSHPPASHTLLPPTLLCLPPSSLPHPPPSTLLQFARPGAPYDNEGDPYEGGARGVNDYVKSLEFPVDSPWRKNRG